MAQYAAIMRETMNAMMAHVAAAMAQAMANMATAPPTAPPPVGGRDWLDKYADGFRNTLGSGLSDMLADPAKAALNTFMDDSALARAAPQDLLTYTTIAAIPMALAIFYGVPALAGAAPGAAAAAAKAGAAAWPTIYLAGTSLTIWATTTPMGHVVANSALTGALTFAETGDPAVAAKAAAADFFFSGAWIPGMSRGGAPRCGTPGGPCFVAGTQVMVPGIESEPILVEAGGMDGADGTNPGWYIAAAGIAIAVLLSEDRTKARRRSRKRRGGDSGPFAELDADETDLPTDDVEDEPLTNENFWSPRCRMNSEAEMHRGLIFEFAGGGVASPERPPLRRVPSALAARDTTVRNGLVPQSHAAGRRRPRWSRFGTALALLLALGCLVRGVWPTRPAPTETSAATAAAGIAPALRPIETIRVGDRVVTDIASRMKSDTAVDPTTWRLVRLQGDVRDDDGTFFGTIDVETLQPPEWLETHDVHVGGEAPFPLDLVELGLREDVLANVTAVEPCPPLQSGPGRVVLSTVSSPSNRVMELTLRDGDGRAEAIRPTAHHRFYSESRSDWVSAEKLNVGEQLWGLNGAITLISLRHLPGIQRVYNMTVDADHAYHVSSLGVLSHNNGNCPDPPPGPGSYTNTHASGKTYSGKGPPSRMKASGNRVAREENDPVVSQDHTPAADPKQSFIDEQNRIDSNGGPNGNTYNKINSPGKKLRDESAP